MSNSSSENSLSIIFTPIADRDIFSVVCKRNDLSFESTFDGGQTGFDILQENIAKCIVEFIPQAMETKLRNVYYYITNNTRDK